MFRGHLCERLDLTGFYNHLLTPDAQTRPKNIVGFNFHFSDPHRALFDITQAENVAYVYPDDGPPQSLDVVLETSHSYDDDAAQGFFLEAFVSPDGTTIVAVPEWDETLAIGFEIVDEDAPCGGGPAGLRGRFKCGSCRTHGTDPKTFASPRYEHATDFRGTLSTSQVV